jgi:hypothetical protein
MDCKRRHRYPSSPLKATGLLDGLVIFKVALSFVLSFVNCILNSIKPTYQSVVGAMSFNNRKFSMNRSSGVPRPSQRRFSTSEPSPNGMVFYLFKHYFPSPCRGLPLSSHLRFLEFLPVQTEVLSQHMKTASA